MRQVKSFSFDGEFNLLALFPVEGVGGEGSIRMSGAIVLPDRFRFEISFSLDGEMIETNGVVIGEDSYIRGPESNQWFKGSPPGSDFLSIVQLVGLLHMPNDARSLSEKQCSKRYASLVECKDANYSTTKSRLL